jgi:hypothetical protein
MKKSTRRKATLTAVKNEIDPQLTTNVASLRAITTCHSLLNEGLFPRRAFEAIAGAQLFLETLHKQMTDECLAHPDADKIPDLKTLREAKNGNAKT